VDFTSSDSADTLNGWIISEEWGGRMTGFGMDMEWAPTALIILYIHRTKLR